jgi:hypothetical protein
MQQLFPKTSKGVTAITDKKTISGEANGSEVIPHEKAFNTRTEVGRADRPDPD